jgi:hypothetical protein
MAIIMARSSVIGFMMICALALGSQAKAEEWKMEQGGTDPGKVMLGMRAGFAADTIVERRYFNRRGILGQFLGDV